MADNKRYPILETIASPRDLRELPVSKLKPLAREVRDFMIETVAQCGGHFGAGLGTVELTVALHQHPGRSFALGRRASGLPAQDTHRSS